MHLVPIFLLISGCNVFGQQILTTIGGWNAYVRTPNEYNSTSKTYPTLIFIPGIGEVGTVATGLLKNGPSKYAASQEFTFTVNGVVERMIVISVQPPSAWPSAGSVDKIYQEIFTRWRVDLDRVYLTGLSMGGMAQDGYIVGRSDFAKKIAGVITLSGVAPSPRGWVAYALNGGKWWGIEGDADSICADSVNSRMAMEDAVTGSSRFITIPGGTHGGWNTYYNPTWTDVDGESLYSWLLKQRINIVPDNAGNCPYGYYMKCGGACSIIPNCHGGSVVCSGTKAVCTSCGPDTDVFLCAGACAVKTTYCVGGTYVCDSATATTASCKCPTGTTLCNDKCMPDANCYGGTLSCLGGFRSCSTCGANYTLCNGKCMLTPTGCANNTVVCSGTSVVCGSCVAPKQLCGGVCATPPTCDGGQLTCSGTALTCTCPTNSTNCGGACVFKTRSCFGGAMSCVGKIFKCTGCVPPYELCSGYCKIPPNCGPNGTAVCESSGLLVFDRKICSVCGTGYTKCNRDSCNPTPPNCQTVGCTGIYPICLSCQPGYNLCNSQCVTTTCSSVPNVDCVVTWGQWTTCTKSCGTGSQQRTGTITTQPQGNGVACPSPLIQTQTCNTQACVVSPCNAMPSNPANGVFSCTTPVASGGICTLTCDSGYSESGNALCTNGAWSSATCAADSDAGDYFLGGLGQNCNTVCQNRGLVCNPLIVTGDSNSIFELLGVECDTAVSNWWANDQPSYVNVSTDSNYQRCLGWKNVPVAGVPCTGAYKTVQRLCRCSYNPCTTVPSNPQFGTFSCTAPIVSGGTCALTCQSGYEKTGDAVCTNAVWSTESCQPGSAVNGGWSTFSATCSAVCGGGVTVRTCTNPSATFGGADCSGHDYQFCNAVSCVTTSKINTVVLNIDNDELRLTALQEFISNFISEVNRLLTVSSTWIHVLNVDASGGMTTVTFEFDAPGGNADIQIDWQNNLNNPNSDLHNSSALYPILAELVPTDVNDQGSSSNDSMMWIGIYVGAAVAGIILLTTIYCCVRRRRAAKTEHEGRMTLNEHETEIHTIR